MGKIGLFYYSANSCGFRVAFTLFAYMVECTYQSTLEDTETTLCGVRPDFDGLLQLTPAQAAKTLGSFSKPFCSA